MISTVAAAVCDDDGAINGRTDSGEMPRVVLGSGGDDFLRVCCLSDSATALDRAITADAEAALGDVAFRLLMLQ